MRLRLIKIHSANPKSFLWFYLLVFSCQSSFSQNSSDKQIKLSDSLQIILTEVRIKSQSNSLINTSAVPVQILNSKDLKNLNSTSLADALRYFSGVQLKDYGGVGGLKTINVRSMGTNHTAVFYDGLQLGNAQNGQVDLGKFSLENMEEIALFNGQNPELLQPARAFSSANSIYIKAKVPHFSIDKKYNSSLTLRYGSFGFINPALSVDYKISEKIYSRLSSEFINAHGRYKFNYSNSVYDTTAVRSNGDVQSFRIETGLYGKLDSISEWSIKFYHYQSERGLPGAIVANKFDYVQRQWDKNNFIQASFQKKITPKYSLALSTKYADDETRYLDPEFITTTGFLDNRYHQKEAYLSWANKYQLFPFWTIAISSDYQHQTLDANIYRFAYPTRNTFLNVFATDFKFKRLSLQANLLRSSIKEKVKELEAAENKQEYTPTFMFSWKPFLKNNVRIRGFYKSIFRTPTFNDLYYTFIGNTFLKPEYTKQYNLGLTSSLSFKSGIVDYLDLQTDVYYNQVNDKIVAIPSANLFRWTMFNLGKVEIKGLDVNTKFSKTISPNFIISGGINYTYQKALDKTSNSFSYNQQIPYTPLHSGSFIASSQYKNLGLNYSFIYTGERYSQKANIPVNYLEPWYTHDASVQYKFKIHQNHLNIRAEINNIWNQYYDVILNFPMPGRSYRFTLNYTI
jgi:vitamin B12 transporter